MSSNIYLPHPILYTVLNIKKNNLSTLLVMKKGVLVVFLKKRIKRDITRKEIFLTKQ